MLKRVACRVGMLALMCLAAVHASAADYKVGFVDAGKVLEEAPQAEDARARLEKEFAPRDRELVKGQKEIREVEDKLVRDGAVMSESERTRLERELRASKRDLKRQQDEFRDDLNLRRNEELQKLQRQVFEAIQALAKQEKYDLILGDGVIFANSRVDITPKIIDYLKRTFKASPRK
jgi:outer membrane protein